MERVISYYNVLKTDGRSSLLPSTIKDCLYVKVNMPSVSKYNPQASVISWLNDRPRHGKTHEKGTTQEWYQGVFPQSKFSKQSTNTANKSY